MDLAFIILAIGFSFWLNSSSVDPEKLKEVVIVLEKELQKEFDDRDKKIDNLEQRIKRLESIGKTNEQNR